MSFFKPARKTLIAVLAMLAFAPSRAAAAEPKAETPPIAAEATGPAAPWSSAPGRLQARWGSVPRLSLEPAVLPRLAAPALETCSEPCARHRNFLIPAIEVPAFVVGLNLVDRWILDKDYAQTRGLRPFFDHLVHGPWEYDADSVWENFVAHPYMGSVMYNFARSSGLSFWWSFGYGFVGSLLWELGGETLPPSINDQVQTPVGGAFLGEILFRAYVMILQSGGDSPGFWRELAAFLLNPSAGFNRLLFGDRYNPLEFDLRPTTFIMVAGRSGYHWSRGIGSVDGMLHNIWWGGEVELDYWMERPHSSVALPFDIFRARVGLSFDTQGPQDAMLLNGMLLGWKQDAGAWTGIAGLVGSYEDLNSGVFRGGGSALGFGVIGQLLFGAGSALTGYAALSGPLMAAGNSQRGSPTTVNEEDHHQGPGGALGALEARLSLRRRLMIDLIAREFIILGRNPLPGWEDQTYARLSSFVRIVGPHCVGLTADFAYRASRTPHQPRIYQHVFAFGLSYAWASDEHLSLRIPPALVP